MKTTPPIDAVTWRRWRRGAEHVRQRPRCTEHHPVLPLGIPTKPGKSCPPYSPTVEYVQRHGHAPHWGALPHHVLGQRALHAVLLDKTTALSQDVVADYRVQLLLPSNSERLYTPLQHPGAAARPHQGRVRLLGAAAQKHGKHRLALRPAARPAHRQRALPEQPRRPGPGLRGGPLRQRKTHLYCQPRPARHLAASCTGYEAACRPIPSFIPSRRWAAHPDPPKYWRCLFPGSGLLPIRALLYAQWRT